MSASPLADLKSVIPSRSLSDAEIQLAAPALLDPAVDNQLKTDFLRAWAIRIETAGELAACVEAFLPRALDPGVLGSWQGKPLVDCCGTGGGGLNLLNISTGLMILL